MDHRLLSPFAYSSSLPLAVILTPCDTRGGQMMVRNKEKDFGKTAEIRGPKAQSEAIRSDGSINSEPQERLKENR
jgi:small acid-soluble spore protein K (minor)